MFEGLFIWEDETYRKLQGTYPVIFLSFADVKQTNGADAIKQVKRIISDVYESCQYLVKWEDLGERQRRQFLEICPQMDDVTAQNALKDLTKYLAKYYGKMLLFFWMNMTPQCRKRMCTDIGMCLQNSCVVFSILHLRLIRIWNGQ